MSERPLADVDGYTLITRAASLAMLTNTRINEDRPSTDEIEAAIAERAVIRRELQLRLEGDGD